MTKFVIAAIVALFTGMSGMSPVAEELISGIKQGKASEVVKNFDQKVSIKLLNQEDVLSRSQAEANLKYFFEKYPYKK